MKKKRLQQTFTGYATKIICADGREFFGNSLHILPDVRADKAKIQTYMMGCVDAGLKARAVRVRCVIEELPPARARNKKPKGARALLPASQSS